MKKYYIYTKKAEKKTFQKMFYERKAGARAFFAGEPVENTPSVKNAWLDNNIIEEVTEDDER